MLEKEQKLWHKTVRQSSAASAYLRKRLGIDEILRSMCQKLSNE